MGKFRRILRNAQNAGAGTAEHFGQLFRQYPKSSKDKLFRLVKALVKLDRHAMSPEQRKITTEFIDEYHFTHGCFPKYAEIVRALRFIRREDFPVAIAPIHGVFSRLKRSQAEYLEHDKLQREIDKQIRQTYGNLPEMKLVALTHNWKNWFQQVAYRTRRYPSSSQVMRFVRFFADYVRQTEDISPQSYEAFLARRRQKR